MTSKPALILAASVTLLVVLFDSPAAKADTIVGNIVLSGSEPVQDNTKADRTGQSTVPLGEAAFISSVDIIGIFSGDMVGAAFSPGNGSISLGGDIPAGEEKWVSAIAPFAFYPDADFISVGGESLTGGTNNVGDTDTFTWVNPHDAADTYTFIIDPLSFVGTTTATGVGDISTLSYTAVGIAEETTDTPGLVYDPTLATLTITASLNGVAGGIGGNIDIDFMATGVAAGQGAPDSGSTAILFAMVGAGLFVANRRRGVLRLQALPGLDSAGP